MDLAEPENADLTKEHALQLAESTAVDLGWDLSKYEAPVGNHDHGCWRFWYQGKVPLQGNHFTVVVESIGRVRVIPGR